MIGIKEKQGPRGRVVLAHYNESNELVKVERFKNLITNGGRAAMAGVLGSGNTDLVIAQFAVGTNNAVAQLTDVALTAPFAKDVDSVTYPASGQVRFDFELSTGEANGKMISEWGLLTGNGTLFSRVVRDTFEKTVGVRIVGYWIIDFNV